MTEEEMNAKIAEAEERAAEAEQEIEELKTQRSNQNSYITKLEGKVKVCKVNVDEQEALASQFSVMSIPFLAVMKNVKLSKASAGYMPKDMVLKLLEY